MDRKAWLWEKQIETAEKLTREARFLNLFGAEKRIQAYLEIRDSDMDEADNLTEEEWRRLFMIFSESDEGDNSRIIRRFYESCNQPLTKQQLGVTSLAGINKALQENMLPLRVVDDRRRVKQLPERWFISRLTEHKPPGAANP